MRRSAPDPPAALDLRRRGLPPVQGWVPIGLALISRDVRVRRLLAGITAANSEFVLRSMFPTALTALAVLSGLVVEIVVLDMAAPGPGGLRCARRLLAQRPDLKVILVSTRWDAALVRRAFAAGVSEYLVKPLRSGQLLATMRWVACRRHPPWAGGQASPGAMPSGTGSITFPPARLAGPDPDESWVGMRACRDVAIASEQSAHDPLTPPEVEILQYLAQGLIWKEIADRLRISHAALRRLKRRLFAKLGHVRNRTEALAKWYQLQQASGQPPRS